MKLIKSSEGSIANDTQILGEVFLDRYSCVTRSILGGYNGIGSFSYVRNSKIGRYTHFGSRVSVGGAAHPLDWVSIASFQYRNDCWQNKMSVLSFEEGNGTEIGNDVWIGDNAVVVSGVKIGSGCVVGAGSIVTKDLQPYTIAVGNPARVLRMRFDELTAERLLETQWWKKNPDDLDGLPLNEPENFVVEYWRRFKMP